LDELVAAVFMTTVSMVYILIAPEGLALSKNLAYLIGGVLTLIIVFSFFVFVRKKSKTN
jgi:hypothetical protein